MIEVRSSGVVVVFDSGETGGEGRNLPATKAVLVLESIADRDVARAKLSRGVASGGDIRLFGISNWFLRSMIAG